jgi:metal-responsive CopG/Arc/MetJ family transcriptional regulator
MIRTQVYFPDDMYNELKLLAAMGEGKFSELVRQGAEKLLQEKKTFKKGKFDPWKDFVGMIRDVKTNAVKDIDEYYKNGIV